uniref:Uncharacterized protein LOC104226654 n=1 Tax=Nicotiana sylvestris TaxID=4096 RepID=A0A1U7WQM8_NICSY|nr:PREDICTED: uncharacterized protein LOC104226654 [Nicotiana sylvestris]
MATREVKQPNAQLLADFVAFMVRGQGRNFQKNRNQTQRATTMGTKYNNSGQKFNKPQQKFKTKKRYNPNVSCTYCGKIGHIQEDCYIIIGFLDDFEFTNQKNYQNQIKANAVLTHEDNENQTGQNIENNNNFGQQLNKEQLAEMMNMYKKAKLVQAGNSGINANAVAGALEHMCFDPNSFLFLTQLPVPLNINLPNSFKGLSMKSPQAFGEVREGLYILEPMDNYSRGTWTFLLSSKSNAFPMLKSFLSMVERQFSTKVKMIRSDNALELGKGSQEAAFLASEGIMHQVSCVETPQQNGIVERKHSHLLEIARGLMFQSRLPMSYWGESILTATHIINRLSSSVLQGKTPFVDLFHHKPKYDYFRNFGCLCYASTLKQDRGKFDERATTCVLLGYPIQQKGYKLLEMSTRRVFVSRDVEFHESHFPFTERNTAHHPIFPTSTFTTEPTYSTTFHDTTQPIPLEYDIADMFSPVSSSPPHFSPPSPTSVSPSLESPHTRTLSSTPKEPTLLRRSGRVSTLPKRLCLQ